MPQIKPLLDEYGIIREANKILPDKRLKVQLLESLAELEDSSAHRMSQFPQTRLHKVAGIKQKIYRADIDKITGWRIHLQYANGQIHLKDIIDGQHHDDVIRSIQAKRSRYN
jgi:hypothetical protein